LDPIIKLRRKVSYNLFKLLQENYLEFRENQLETKEFVTEIERKLNEGCNLDQYKNSVKNIF